MSLPRPTLEDIIALCKRRGLVFQSAEIYGGINGVYDFGPLGTLLKDNIRNAWKKSIKSSDKTILFLEGSLLGPESIWKASGHSDNFNDPMIDCTNCKKRFRADDPDINITGPCPHCGKNAWTDIRQFNMMFKTDLGAVAGQGSSAYLRPETAQSIFINFKNVMSSNRVKLPFGIAQIGKSFRNEITPKQFLFRMREFEQMELEWFCSPQQSQEYFDYWSKIRLAFYKTIGINPDRIRLRAHEQNELSHYSSKTSDVEYEYPFGWKELEGIAHRGDFDLTQHSKYSGKDLSVFDEETQQSYMPHVIECSVGSDRLFLTVLFDAYRSDNLGGEERTVLALHPSIAPIKAAFLPLTKKLSDNMKQIYRRIANSDFTVEFDESGSIGKRYRRQDEIGTPLCFTYDFDSLNDNCVTVRNRDTLKQERISNEKIELYLTDMLHPKKD
ncbi:MAG TPA: glycine--tRNA ligase [Candidatus Babeliales bacterium]|nr:glycine--tRNA ligase [Candidatus Babeliales bacterium]